MQATEYIWHNGKIVPWNDAKIHVLTHSLHYGNAVFEGIRFYVTDQGSAVFRLEEHLQRMIYSASAIKMALPYDESELKTAIIDLVQKNKLEHGYIRPIAYYGYGKMGVNPAGAPVELSIACWPWGAYLTQDAVDVQTSKFIRVIPRTTIPDAKLSGNYLNAIFAILQLQGTRYHEALFLDEMNYIAEGPAENFFMIKDQIVYTPLPGTILLGVTRDTVMNIVSKLGYKIIEQNLRLEDVYQADEAFFTGTAAEITPIRSLDDKLVGQGNIGPITQKIKAKYADVVRGNDKDFIKYLTYLK